MVDTIFVFDAYTIYIFGSLLYTALAFLVIVTLVGIRYRFPLEAYMVLFPPAIGILISPYFPTLGPLLLMGIGLIIGIALVAIVRR